MTIQERLRALVESIRRRPIPISDVIPLLLEAADDIDMLEVMVEQFRNPRF